MSTHIPFALLATALACSVFAAPAHALRARVFVSKAGADVGACSFSAPCQSLGYALSGVEPGGEITILDSGGYNPITITQGVTITVPPGVEAGIAVGAGTDGITINGGPNDIVSLRGLTLDGATVGRNGIVFNAGARLEIIDSMVQNFATTGIAFQPTTPSTLLISNTRVLDNPNSAGIYLLPQVTPVQATIDHVTVENNNYGIYVDASNVTSCCNSVWTSITNSMIASNLTAGIGNKGKTSSVLSIVAVKDTTVRNINAHGLEASPNSQTFLSHVLLDSDATDFYCSAGAVIITDATNISFGEGFYSNGACTFQTLSPY
jgi:hypothetical protein